MTPTCPPELPRRLQDGPGSVQDACDSVIGIQDRPKSFQDRPETPPRPPRTFPRGPETTPRGPFEHPKKPQERPKNTSGGPNRPKRLQERAQNHPKLFRVIAGAAVDVPRDIQDHFEFSLPFSALPEQLSLQASKCQATRQRLGGMRAAIK